MQPLIAVLMLPIILLNILGAVVGVIWLMILGEWGALGVALSATIFGVFACSFALMPGLLVAAPAMILLEKGGAARFAAYPLMFINLLWTFVVMCAWALFWFGYYLKQADVSSLTPMLLIAFSVATSPWAFMAQKEAQEGNNHSSNTAFFLQLACAVVFALLAFVGVHPKTALITFLIIMSATFLLNVVISVLEAIAE